MTKKQIDQCPFCGDNIINSMQCFVVTIPIFEEPCGVVFCPNCYLYYKSWIPSGRYLKEYYNSNYSSYQISTDAENRTLASFQTFEEKYFAKPGRLLDIGASTGLFVKAGLTRGWDAWGIEPYSGAFVNMSADVKNRVHQCFLDDTFEPTEKYDLITLSDVIEHVENPREIIYLSVKLLKLNGIIVMSTPDFSSLGCRIYKDSWGPVLEPSHFSFWSPKMIRDALPSLGLSIEELYSSGNPVGYNVGVNRGVSRSDLIESTASKTSSYSWGEFSNALSQSARSRMSQLKKTALRSEVFGSLVRDLIRMFSLGDNLTLVARRVS